MAIAYASRYIRAGQDGIRWLRLGLGQPREVPKARRLLAEIESVFTRPVIILPDKENLQGERRFRAIGSTNHGRRAFVVFTWRQGPGQKLLRPISARYMHREEVADYEKAYPHI